MNWDLYLNKVNIDFIVTNKNFQSKTHILVTQEQNNKTCLNIEGFS
jgi:capsular polysaccharide biosynthesis protein